MIRFLHILFVLVCIGSMFIYSYQFTDPYIVPKWCMALLVLFVMLLYTATIVLLRKSIFVDMSIWGSIIVFSCLLQALYGISQYIGFNSSNTAFRVTGSFDNPAGFAACICTGLPFISCVFSNHRKYMRYAGQLVGIVMIIAVALSYSRTGIVCIAVLCYLYICGRLHGRKMIKCFIAVVLVLLMSGCYWIKKDSADGRLLIWQCSIDMVKDVFWMGYGIEGFDAHYMDYQADYFKHHEQSRFAMLADNVKQPFNEYLRVLVNFGVIGLLVLCIIVLVLINCYKRYPDNNKKIAFYSFISIGVFSIFSYPFNYPFTWMVTLLLICIITHEYIRRIMNIVWIRNSVCMLILVGSLSGICILVNRISAEMEWCKVSRQSGQYDELLTFYEELQPRFESNPYFLYNYAAVLQDAKQYKKSLEVALLCRQYWADYDLELLLGENYQYLGQSELADVYYSRAAMMCPSRFWPLYKKFYLYKENGAKERMIDVAEKIVHKPMKFKQSIVLMMKREMKRELSRLKENDIIYVHE